MSNHWTPIIEGIRLAHGWPIVEGLEEKGFIAAREAANGDLIAVLPLTWNRGRITLGPGPNSTITRPWGDVAKLGYDGGADFVWDFDDLEAAVEAALKWDPMTQAEPSGFAKAVHGRML